MAVWALDLDGVLWTGKMPIVGSADAVQLLRHVGHEVVFATNNAFATEAEQVAKLASFGIEAAGSVVSSAMAGASVLSVDEQVLVLGGPGAVEAVSARGASVIEGYVTGDAVPDSVLVALDWDLSYDRLRAAVQAILAGARFVATNDDRTYPTENGLYPGAGAIVGAVHAATEVVPIVCGKPHQPMADLLIERYGDTGVMVGDRPETDGLFAEAMGYRFELVLSGVTTQADLPVEPTPASIHADLLTLVSERV